MFLIVSYGQTILSLLLLLLWWTIRINVNIYLFGLCVDGWHGEIPVASFLWGEYWYFISYFIASSNRKY
jgi:hypothetical protein